MLKDSVSLIDFLTKIVYMYCVLSLVNSVFSLLLTHVCSVWLFSRSKETLPKLTSQCSGRMGCQAEERPSINTHWRLLCYLGMTRG